MKKFCKDCKWIKPSYTDLFRRELSSSFSKCRNPAVVYHGIAPDLVTGKVPANVRYCDSARRSEMLCGIDAKLFEPKE